MGQGLDKSPTSEWLLSEGTGRSAVLHEASLPAGFPNEALNASCVTPQREHVHHQTRVEPETCSTILERSSVSGHIMTENFGKTRTAEVTICTISERTARSPSTVTALLKRSWAGTVFKLREHGWFLQDPVSPKVQSIWDNGRSRAQWYCSDREHAPAAHRLCASA